MMDAAINSLLVDAGCFERGCVCYDPRDQVPPVPMVKALAESEQEPVAWMMPDGKTVDKWGLQFYGGLVGKPLYTIPPQRTWVGLTQEELQKILQEVSGQGWKPMVEAIEAKLKEKNL